MASPVLVGDIGGTHVRFAVAEFDGRWVLTSKQDIEASSACFMDLLQGYLRQWGCPPKAISLAVAGPVINGAVVFTNRLWRVSETELLGLGFTRALLLNDFASLAFAAPRMTESQLFTLGPDQPGMAGEPLAVMGAGTGFGASCLIRHRGFPLSIACEAGHIGFAPTNDKEDAVLKILRMQFGRVSVERLLSGPGLENLLHALQKLQGFAEEKMDAAAIMDRAKTGHGLPREVVAMFCAIYGAVAGDLALAQGARGGVFIAGGIAQKIAAVLAASQFRARFEDKGRLSYYVQPIPTRIITDPDAALIGAALAFDSAST